MARILLVDDQPDALTCQAMLLELVGHKVAKAQDGHEALRLCSEIHPEVMLLDIEMPGMSGIEVARRIRDGACTPLPGLVALSGYQGLQTSPALKLFDAFVLKPASLEAIESAITATIARRGESIF